MLPRRFDRYLVRETVGPFLLALAGLVLFILLNVILSLSYLMVDRGIGLMTFLRLILYRVPAILVLAVPMAALFATFLGLGRLGHDREIMAFESIGIPLRRILLPLLIAATFVAGLDFALYNWGVPAAEASFQSEFRGIIFSQGAPRITANEFFKGPEDQFFYVRRYDTDSGSMHDVFIYDITGRVFPQADTSVTILTAQEGQWADPMLELMGGRIYGFNLDGELVYSGEFESLAIPMEQSIEQVFARSKTPSEMGIGELLGRIRAARSNAQRTNEYIVELHLKLSLPLTTVIFVLLGGAVSLIFGTRSRAIGIVISLALVGVFQGLLFLTQTFGQRGVIDPALAPWIPNIVFGILGFALFLWVDRLASRNLWNRLRRRLPHFVVLLFCLFALPARAQEAPLDLTADTLFISADQTSFSASGSVIADYEGMHLVAETVELWRADDSTWLIEARGDAELTVQDDLVVAGDVVRADLEVRDGTTRTTRFEADGFSGRTRFTNSADEEHTVWFRGETGTVTFDNAGDVERIEVERGALSTCDCCGVPLDRQPYSLHAQRMLLYPDRLIVVFGLTARIAGVSSFWLPVYVQPLEETLDSPLFPAIGRSALRGWFLKWNVPFYISESLFGSVLLDIYSGSRELGTGLVTHYAFGGHEGRLRLYSFPANIGDSVFEFSARHQLPSAGIWTGSGRLDYAVRGPTTELDYSVQAGGASNDWNLSVSAAREVETRNTDDEDESNDVTKTMDRIPEITMTRSPWIIDMLSIQPRFDLGHFREVLGETPAIEATRLSGGLDLSTAAVVWKDLRLTPQIGLQATTYVGDRIQQGVASLQTGVVATWRGATVAYDLRLVRGDSPFEFDTEVAAHHLGWEMTSRSWGTLTIGSGIDIDTGTVDPLSAHLTWVDWANWTLTASYDLSQASFGTIDLAGTWSGDALDLSWSIPYRPADASFGMLSLSVDASRDWLDMHVDAALDSGILSFETEIDADLSMEPFSLMGSVSFTDMALGKLALEATFESPGGWGGRVAWTYTGGVPSLDTVRYGLFWDVGGCLRVGIDREASDAWLYASVLAFPEAVLRYAPESARIEAGR